MPTNGQRANCLRCLRPVTWFKGLWWSNDDDFQCPDGEENHRPTNSTED